LPALPFCSSGNDTLPAAADQKACKNKTTKSAATNLSAKDNYDSEWNYSTALA
jgi:hypothetical protein